MTELAPNIDITSDADIASNVFAIDRKNPHTEKKNIFTFNPVDYQDEFAKNDFTLIDNGVDANFLEVAIEQAEKQKSDKKDISNHHFKGKKHQYPYEFDEWGFYDNGLKTLARTACLSDLNKFCLSLMIRNY